MSIKSNKSKLFRTIATHPAEGFPIFPEHVHSSLKKGCVSTPIPEHCQSLLFYKSLAFNLFRSIPTHFSPKRMYLCPKIELKSKDMAGITVDMSTIKQMLQMHQLGYSNRRIAKELELDKSTVNKYINTVEDGKMDIDKLLRTDDPVLDHKFNAGNPAYTDARMKTFLDELPMYIEKLGHKHVTRFLVWEEYKKMHPEGYGKSQFFFHLKQNLIAAKGPTAVLTDTYVPGQKLYVDFCGDRLSYIDIDTGEIIKCEVFVATLPCTDYAYAICIPSQKVEDFLHAIRMCFEHIGGVPLIVVPDNLKSAVVKPDKYEPKINKALQDMGNFYHFAVVPCQPRSPTQKALVEDQVRLVYRRIYARLRDRQFYCIEDLNKAVWELLDKHNRTRLQKRPYSREEHFHAIEKAALQPLPQGIYEMKYYADVHVQKNGYVEISKDNHSYSVPYTLVGKKARIIFTRSIVKIYVDGLCVATHPRVYKWGYTTVKEHLASNNRAILERSPQYYMERAYKISHDFGLYVTELFSGKRSSNPPEIYYKTCNLLIGLHKKYDEDAFNATCRDSLVNKVFSGRQFEAILKHKTMYPCDVPNCDAPVPTNHNNMRGTNYYK